MLINEDVFKNVNWIQFLENFRCAYLSVLKKSTPEDFGSQDYSILDFFDNKKMEDFLSDTKFLFNVITSQIQKSITAPAVFKLQDLALSFAVFETLMKKLLHGNTNYKSKSIVTQSTECKEALISLSKEKTKTIFIVSYVLAKKFLEDTEYAYNDATYIYLFELFKSSDAIEDRVYRLACYEVVGIYLLDGDFMALISSLSSRNENSYDAYYSILYSNLISKEEPFKSIEDDVLIRSVDTTPEQVPKPVLKPAARRHIDPALKTNISSTAPSFYAANAGNSTRESHRNTNSDNQESDDNRSDLVKRCCICS